MSYTKKQKVKTLLSKRAQLKTKLSTISKALFSGLLISSALMAGSSHAQVGLGGGISGERSSTVKMPNAEFIERVIDLRVKVLGGEVKFERTWSEGSWRMNEAWSNLVFYYQDPKPIYTIKPLRSSGVDAASTRSNGLVLNPPKEEENKINYISRAGSIFELSDDNSTEGVQIYVESNSGQSFIRRSENNWRWYDRQGNWILYDRDGRLLSYGDRNGINVKFIRDSDARRLGVQDHHGNTVLSFTYDGEERLTSVTDNAGRKVTYQWNGNSLIAVVDAQGNTTRYGYDKNGNLISRTEPDGSMTSITHHGETAKRGRTELNSQSRTAYIYPERPMSPPTFYKSGSASGGGQAKMLSAVITAKRSDAEVGQSTPPRTGSITSPSGATTLFNVTYNNASKEYTATQIDELGKNTTEVYDSVGQLLSINVNGDTVLTRQYGANNSSIKTTNERGLTTTVTQNEVGKPIRITYANGAAETYTYDNTFNKPLTHVDQLGVKTEWTYDAHGNALTRIDAVGKDEQRFNRWTYDAYGQAITYTIASGNGTNGDAVTSSYTYDLHGNVTSITDPMGNTTQFTYNVQGQVLSVTNALGHTWAYDYTANGHLQKITNPLGDSVVFQTDAQGRVIQVTDAQGRSSTVSYAYQNKGLTVTKTDALGNATVYVFDAKNRLTSVTQPSGDVAKQVYDARGRLVQQIDAAGNIIKTQYGAAGTALAGLPVHIVYPTYQAEGQYNALGLPTEVVQQLGQEEGAEELKTRMNYNALGMLLSMTAPDGATTQLQYDALGNQTKHIDALGGQTQQVFDALGNLTSVVDAKGNTHRFEYDKNGNLLKALTPNRQATQYAYDAVGQLVQVQDAAGNVTQYTYNAVGLMVQEFHRAAGQTTPEQTINYVYDKNGQLLEAAQLNQNAYGVNTHHKFTRDELGRIVREDITYGGGEGSSSTAITKTLRYGFDADGRNTSITYPDGTVQTTNYAQGQLKSITRPDGKNMGWGAYEWLRAQQFEAPSVEQMLSFDGLQRTTSIEAKTADNATVLQRGYTYDKAGNITSRTTQEGEYIYGYDKLSRLTAVNPPQNAQEQGLPVETYAYDKVHNRIGSSHQAGEWVYNQDNQLLKFGTGVDETTYTYNANGHVATETKNGVTKTYTYNAADRLVKVNQTMNGVETEVARYAYDAFGRRISKTVNGETIYFIYSNEGLLAELNEGGDITRAYGWEPNTMYGTTPLWQAEVSNNMLSTAQFHTLITDHLGTPQVAVNDQGRVTWKAVSESFGKTLTDPSSTITMNLRFPGQYFDEETNTHYNYFRDYNPQTGRYIQKDPIGLNGGVNWYGYVGENPLISLDFFGLQATLNDPNNCDKEDPCATLRDKIDDAINRNKRDFNNRGMHGLRYRFAEQINGAFGPGMVSAAGKIPWDTHATEITKTQDYLRKKLEEWDNQGCGGKGYGLPADVLVWVNKPVPLPSEWVGSKKVEDGGVGIGTIIIVGGIVVVGATIIFFFPPSATVVAPAMGAGAAAAI